MGKLLRDGGCHVLTAYSAEAGWGRGFIIDSVEKPSKMAQPPAFSGPRMRVRRPQIGVFQRNPLFIIGGAEDSGAAGVPCS